MIDQRIIDRVTIEELEQALLIKRRQLRQQRLQQLSAAGRLADNRSLLESTSLELDKPTVAAPSRGPNPRAARPRRVRDTLLLAIEVAALGALLVIVFNTYDALRTLNREVDVARAAPEEVVAPTATPIISFDRLPGGHTPPSDAAAAVPEVPAHLQKWIQPAPDQPVPAPVAAAASRVVIPDIGVDAPVVEGVTWDDLKKGIGHLPGSANPGQRGNVYLAAHNDIFGEIFRDLDKLEMGDEFVVYAGDQPFRYVVTAKRIIEPTDVSVMKPSTQPIATLQTCYPYLVDTQRLVVIGELAD